MILAVSPAGMYARFPTWAPTARKAASKPPSATAAWMSVTVTPDSSRTPMARIRSTSASITSLGSR